MSSINAARAYFISYRRDTEGKAAEATAAALRLHCGEEAVFHDRDPASLPPGSIWPLELISHVLRHDVTLVLIGPGWLEELTRRNQDAAGGWIRDIDSQDWVRREVMFALHFGKHVIPVLIRGASLPTQEKLPPDLRGLADLQTFVVPHHPDWRAEMSRLVREAGQPQSQVRPAVYPPLGRPARTPPEAPDDLRSRFGQRWQPEHERDSPHQWDYKFCILDPEVRHRVRLELLASHASGELQRGFSLPDLHRFGEPRKFAQSSLKSGMFVQASCLVTDGLDTAQVTHVLLGLRDQFQINDPTRIDPRNVDGESCLFASCLTSFDVHRKSGHLPMAVLNDLQNPNPWAVFSRKLLFPDSMIDCRFLGLGFNLSNPDKEYLHLIWHVRTRSCPRLMLVPAREEIHYDDPTWQTLDQLARYDFEKAPIDRLVVERVFRLRLPVPRKGLPSMFCGFVEVPNFDLAHTRRSIPERWLRDTVPLDLLRMFQQSVHRGRRRLTGLSAPALLTAFADDLRSISDGHRLPVQISDSWTAADGEAGSERLLMLTDETGNAIVRYLLLGVVSDQPQLTHEVVTRVRERAHGGLPDGSIPAAVFVLQGVHSPSRFELQGSVSLHDAGATPIHVVRVALGWAGRPVKRVAHALIPVRPSATEPADRFLVTLHPGDELPRLPGGKIEGEESPGQAVVRELGEELGLSEDEVTVVRCLKEDGFLITENSPSTGLLTDYRLFTFLIRIDDAAAERIRRRMSNVPAPGLCRVWAETFETWRATGLGYDRTYPDAVLDLMTPEERSAAALVIPPV